MTFNSLFGERESDPQRGEEQDEVTGWSEEGTEEGENNISFALSGETNDSVERRRSAFARPSFVCGLRKNRSALRSGRAGYFPISSTLVRSNASAIGPPITTSLMMPSRLIKYEEGSERS